MRVVRPWGGNREVVLPDDELAERYAALRERLRENPMTHRAARPWRR